MTSHTAAALASDPLLDLIVDGWWGDLARALDDDAVVVTANSRATAHTWCQDLAREMREANYGAAAPESVRGNSGSGQVWDAYLAVRAGITLADLKAVAGHYPDVPSPTHAVTVLMMAGDAAVFAGLSLRAMVGWLLAIDPADRADRGLDEDWAALRGVQPWLDAGLGEDGWRYAAAGLSVAEALGAIKAGSMTDQDLAVMAALRGRRTPVG